MNGTVAGVSLTPFRLRHNAFPDVITPTRNPGTWQDLTSIPLWRKLAEIHEKGISFRLMARVLHPVTCPAPGRWLIVACTLLGFVGQLLILSQARPGEMPRATIERLLGIDIASGQAMADCEEQHGPAAMAMGGLYHVLAHEGGDDVSHHDHDGSCALCPLLHLPAMALAAQAFLPLPPMPWMRPHCRPGQPRGPPAISPGVPPSRGPPPAA